MKRIFIFLTIAAIGFTGCRSTPPPSAVPEGPGQVSNDQDLQQLRRIASMEDGEEEVMEDGDDPAFEGGNTDILRPNRGAPWEFDPGPDMNTPVGRRYAELFARTPNYRSIGRFLLSTGANDRGDKFRWQFGPMFYRGRLGANQVKVLIIGQEGAQDENVSDRSFTGGTGGRMQNMLAALGVDRSYLFVNTFIYTIQGQYAEYAPMMVRGDLQWRNLLVPNMLSLAQDPRSPIVQHRHEVLDHVISSNMDSLRLIIAVGGAAQDSLATYIMSKGGRCLTSIAEPQEVQLVRYGSAPAGGNKRFYFPVDAQGRNLLARSGDRPDYSNQNVQAAAKKYAMSPEVQRRLVKMTSGPMKNGLVDLRQTTMRLETCQVGGRNNTIYGLQGLGRDIRFIGVQHPGSNSPTLEAKFTAALSQIRSWQGRGWKLEPERPQPFDSGFRYTHVAVPRRDFRFGLPDVVGQGNTSTTRRAGGIALEIGSRGRGEYPKQKPPDAYVPDQQYQATDLPYEPSKTQFQAFDAGPGEAWAKVFTEGLPFPQLIQANRTAAPQFGAWAIYRGRPSNTEVLVLADQASHDDMWVGRALMGLDGQRLQGFLNGIGAGLNYTIIRTLPVDTMGGDSRNIQQLLEISRAWRNGVLTRIVQENKGRLKMVLTMGPQAEQEIRGFNPGVPIISLTGPQGYQSAYQEIQRMPQWATGRRMTFNGAAPIPIAREDIPYGMRRWTGTAGDRVLRSSGKMSGQLYQIVAPDWATRGPAAAPRPLPGAEASYLQKLRYPPMM